MKLPAAVGKDCLVVPRIPGLGADPLRREVELAIDLDCCLGPSVGVNGIGHIPGHKEVPEPHVRGGEDGVVLPGGPARGQQAAPRDQILQQKIEVTMLGAVSEPDFPGVVAVGGERVAQCALGAPDRQELVGAVSHPTQLGE